jgi:hypothetical protein
MDNEQIVLGLEIILPDKESIRKRAVSDGFNGNSGGAEKGVALAQALVANATFRNNGSFDKRSGGDSAGRRSRDRINENLEARLTEHDRQYS